MRPPEVSGSVGLQARGPERGRSVWSEWERSRTQGWGKVAAPVPGFSGHGFSLKGEKGRFVLPPDFRKPFAESARGRTLCLAKHDKWPCLTGFLYERTDNFEAQLDREEERAIRFGDAEWDREVRMAQLWGFKQLPFDASGRFVMPELLIELGGIEDAAFFQGAGQFFTLWAPDALHQMGAAWEASQAACRALEAEAGSKGARK